MKVNEIISQAIGYILNHINEEITVEDVANHCNFSKFYFNRLFKSQTGESVYSFIKRIRIEQSALRLKVNSNSSITDIGYEYGYSPSNYSVVFKKHHQLSPADFRKNIPTDVVQTPFFDYKQTELHTFEEYQRNVTIQTLPEYHILYERQIGCYENMCFDWRAFMQKYQSYITEDTLFIERSFDDPSITDQNACLYDICMTVSEDVPNSNTTTIPGGKFMVYDFNGYAKDIFSAYQGLFNVWFPGSNYELDERYGYDIYHEVRADNSFHMSFCLPIK